MLSVPHLEVVNLFPLLRQELNKLIVIYNTHRILRVLASYLVMLNVHK